MKFKELNLSDAMLETLELIGYKEASPIQASAIPVALAGKDIIGQAQTGTGKTASFGIPIVEMTDPKKGLQHIILAPSRELATQIYNEIHKLTANKGIKVIDIIGGVSYTVQQRNLKLKPQIIVATPGRYIDNLEKGLIKHDDVKTFTLDEADEMLNFGFYKEIMKIRKSIKQKLQTFFFTATFNAKIKKLAQEILHDPEEITISQGLSSSDKVEQKFMVMKEKQKLNSLVSLLHMLQPAKAVIFGRTKRRVDELQAALKEMGFAVVGIQGDMRQRERANAMRMFREGKVNILVGTDVIARGIDVDGIDYVFNFDLPTELEYYTHRIGRTGRAGAKGTAISFLKETEKSYYSQIMKTTSSNAEQWPLPTDEDLKEVKEKQLKEDLGSVLALGKNKFSRLGGELAKQYTPEQLGIIIAQLHIGNSTQSYDITLSGEQGMDSKGGGRGGGRNRGRGRSYGGNRGGRSNDRRSSGGSGNRGRRPSGGNGDRNRSGSSSGSNSGSGSRDRRRK